jgi:hypothetical protein
MKDIRSMLQNGDPIAREGDLSAADSGDLRRRLQSADTQAPPTRRRALAPLTATLVLLIVGGVWITRRAVPQSPPQAFPSVAVESGRQPVGLRQLQFITPGGTRVFWTFHPQMETR